MQLSVITDEISQDFAHALDVMREYSVHAAEIRGLWGTNIADLNDAQIQWAKKLIKDNGTQVVCLASPLYKCELDGDGGEPRKRRAKERSLADQLPLLNRCVQLCDVFETRVIRIFSFWKRGELTEEIDDRIAGILREAADIAEKAGVTLALENEHACYHGTGQEAAKLLAKVNSPALRAVWDPGNAFFAGDYEPFPGGYNALKGRIEHIHIKDAERLASGRHRFLVVGEGEIDYPAQFAALKTDGYKGFMSLETHYRPYANTPELGSRMCLTALDSMLRSL